MFLILRKILNGSCASSRICCTFSLRLFSTRNKEISLAIFDLLLNKYQFSRPVATKLASVLHRVKDAEDLDSVLLFLKQTGFSNAQLEKTARYRHGFLRASLENTIKPKIKVFQDLGFSPHDIARIISSNPMILHLKMDSRIIPSFSVLKGLLGTNDAVAEVCRRSSWVLTGDLEKRMLPNIEMLKSYGIPMELILKSLRKYPSRLSLHPNVLRKSAEKAEEMGFNRSSNMFINAVRVVSSFSDEAWELKLKAFRDCGFSESNILEMFRKLPNMFGISPAKLKQLTVVLLDTGKYHISCIVNNPVSLSCSIEKRYAPRLRVLEILESKNLIKNWPGLATGSQISDDKFFDKFVGPYKNQVGKVFPPKYAAHDKKEKKVKVFD